MEILFLQNEYNKQNTAVVQWQWWELINVYYIYVTPSLWMPYLVSTPREILLNGNWIEISVYFSAAPMKQLYIRSMVHYRKYLLIVQPKKTTISRDKWSPFISEHLQWHDGCCHGHACLLRLTSKTTMLYMTTSALLLFGLLICVATGPWIDITNTYTFQISGDRILQQPV